MRTSGGPLEGLLHPFNPKARNAEAGGLQGQSQPVCIAIYDSDIQILKSVWSPLCSTVTERSPPLSKDGRGWGEGPDDGILKELTAVK